MAPADYICVALLLAIFSFAAWRISRIESQGPERELREHEADLDLASGKYMRFRRTAEIEDQGRERVGLDKAEGQGRR